MFQQIYAQVMHYNSSERMMKFAPYFRAIVKKIHLLKPSNIL